MADLQGRVGKLGVSVAGSTYTDLGGINDMSWSTSRGEIDVSDFDGGGWEENLPGLGSFTISASLNWDEANAGQVILLANNTAGTQLYYRYRPSGDTSSANQVIFRGTLTSFETTQSVDGKVELSMEVKGTAVPVVSTI